VQPDRANAALAARKTISDAELSKMDYYVEGVVGKLPASK